MKYSYTENLKTFSVDNTFYVFMMQVFHSVSYVIVCAFLHMFLYSSRLTYKAADVYSCNVICWYRHTLQLARQLADRALEAQACYSLGNAYTLLGDYVQAIEYHALHLKIARELRDKVGESRACWSLSNAYRSVGNDEQALSYVLRHRDICVQVCPSRCVILLSLVQI